MEYSGEKKFIYFKSPNSIRRFLSSNELIKEDFKYEEEIIEWISNNVHPDWYYSAYLKIGIGIHHGKTPIFLRKYIESEYAKKNGFIHTILCTSTLMEGINTPTNKLVIYDAPRGTFELNNLIGRVGRLNPQNPIIGKIQILDKETINLYDPNQWIELNILYETNEILTKSHEDEILYLDKTSLDGKAEENIKSLETELTEKFTISMSEIIEAGIEFELLMKFINNFETITTHDKERSVINDIKYKLLRNENSYLQGMKIKSYSFSDKYEQEEYIFDAVYFLIINGGKMKPIIDKFEKTYNACVNDINIFIDTLFQIDEFIKFKMMKMISIFELFSKKQLLDNVRNRAFIQSMYMIESYYDSPDGFDRILSDMGIPKEDIDNISNKICQYNDTKGTENKLLRLKTEKIFQDLSPFSKKIIEEI